MRPFPRIEKNKNYLKLHDFLWKVSNEFDNKTIVVGFVKSQILLKLGHFKLLPVLKRWIVMIQRNLVPELEVVSEDPPKPTSRI